MIRQLVTSSAFRISETRPACQLDPTNKLYWRFPGRRLSAEEIRDSVLAISGNLNLAIGGPVSSQDFPQSFVHIFKTRIRMAGGR